MLNSLFYYYIIIISNFFGGGGPLDHEKENLNFDNA